MAILNRENKLTIAIDGGAGTGKTAIASELAKTLGLSYVSTGQMYRLVTFYMAKDGELDILGGSRSDIEETQQFENIVLDKVLEEYLYKRFYSKITYKDGRICYDNKEVSDKQLMSKVVNENVSEASQNPIIRYFCTSVQKDIATRGGVILEGRDIGTVVAPRSDFKFFIAVDIKTKTKRRFAQLNEKGIETTIEEVKENIQQRDKIDSTRAVAPLVKADDAIEIDNSNSTLEQTVKYISDIIEKGNE